MSVKIISPALCLAKAMVHHMRGFFIAVMKTKVCPKCKAEKSLSEFRQRKSGKRKGHFISYCKGCEREDLKKRRPAKLWRYQEREGFKICRKCERKLPVSEFYLRKDRGKRIARCRECKKEDQRKAHKRDRETFNKKMSMRLSNDLEFRLKHYYRSRIRKAIKRQGADKHGTFRDLCGCSPKKLANHLESKFCDGMTWDNYGRGGWHVDHIRPCASFDLTDPEQQKKCFHYTNLQPLWQFDNLSKSDRDQFGVRACDKKVLRKGERPCVWHERGN